MIDWMRYKLDHNGEKRNAWVGRIAERPLYVIKPEGMGGDAMQLVDVAADPKVRLATRTGVNAVLDLQKLADQHRADLTGGS
jgi:3-dehydroquinate synthase class II